MRAQIVADGATNTLSNVTTNITGTVTVGTNGSFTLLILSDNALLTNSANSIIGLNTTARSNEVRLVSPSARWLMGGNLFVGSNGAMNRLMVSNGAFVENNNGFLGNRIDGSNNVALVTGVGSVWRNRNDITVGTFGRNNQVIVSNGGWVVSQNTRLGGNVSGSNNLMLVTGAGSVWSNASTVFVGNAAPGKMVIEAGGLVHDDSGTVGGFSSASNSEALVTGPGSRWNNASFLTIGNNVGRNRLVVSNGAAVWSGSGAMGSVSAASSNQVLITGAGSVWSNQTFLTLGGSSVGNRVDVSDGGRLTSHDGNISSSSNTVLLTGGGSGWNNLGGLIVGSVGNGNVLIASNGATVLSSNATIGVNGGTANNNLALITGAGTLWSNRNDLVVGSFGVGNRLQVDNGATVLSGNLFVGFNSLSADNRVTVDGGTLRVTNAAGTGVLDVRRGTNLLQSGLVEVDHLIVTNQGNRFVFDGGTLLARKITHNNQNQFRVGNEASPATLILAGSGPYSVSQIIVSANATLIADANITGSIILQNRSTLAPGGPLGGLGTLGGSANIVLAGTNILEISKNGAALANDQVAAGGIITFTFGAVVVVTNIGPTALAAGDRFQLFTAGSVAGTLETLSLPPLPAGLQWMTNLFVDGSIEVESLAPNVTTLPASGLSQTNATLNGAANPKGTDTTAWFEFGFSTNYGNVTPPQALGSGNGDASFNQMLTGLFGGVTYHFRAVASNSFGVEFGADQSFQTPGPFVQTLPAVPGSGAATLNGVANPNGTNTSAWFEFGFTTNYGNVTSAQSIGSGTNNTNFSRLLTNLVSDLYQFRAVASNSLGVAFGSNSSFTIGPSVTTLSANPVIGDLVGLNGSANPRGTNTSVWFEWGATTNFGNITPPQPVGSGTNSTDFNQFLNDLSAGTYHFRAVASNAIALAFGARLTFTIGPTVTTQPAGPVVADTAGLNGTANPGGANTLAWFEWGTTTSFGNVTPPQPLGGGTVNVNFNQFLSDLTAGTYHFRAVASNSLAVAFGANRSFNIGPTVQTLPAVALDAATATLKGVANPKGASTSGWFEWGTTTSYGNFTLPQPLGSGTNNVVFSEVVTGLTAGVIYHFRAVASNGLAVVFGGDHTFPTSDVYIKASNTGPDAFGASMAFSGDTLVIGAPNEDSNATGVNGDGSNNSALISGAAYVFVRNGGIWTQQAYLKASNTGANDQFGFSVAVSGDTVIVGAPLEDSNATGINGDGSNNSSGSSGAAYVFVRSGTNWSQQAYLKASNTESSDQFGLSVAASGDTIVVGANLEDSNATGVNGNSSDNSATNSGAAYVFVRSGTNWTQQAYLKASNADTGDAFGRRVAVFGGTIVVAARSEDSNATGVNGDGNDNSATTSGAAYVFVRNGITWSQQAYLKASNTGESDQFGESVAVSGETIVVGANLEDSNATGVNGDSSVNSATNSGAAYVFVRNGTIWTQQAYLKASNTEVSDSFGTSVALSGETVMVGAFDEDSISTGVNGDGGDNSAPTSGAAYAFVRTGTNWLQWAYLKASNTDPNDQFGSAVAVAGDTVAVGAPREASNATGINGDGSNNSEPFAGAAYVFGTLPPLDTLLTITPSAPGQVTISWTPPLPGFVLQESLTLSTISWTNSPSGETNPITVPATEPTKFYRLFKP